MLLPQFFISIKSIDEINTPLQSSGYNTYIKYTNFLQLSNMPQRAQTFQSLMKQKVRMCHKMSHTPIISFFHDAIRHYVNSITHWNFKKWALKYFLKNSWNIWKFQRCKFHVPSLAASLHEHAVTTRTNGHLMILASMNATDGFARRCITHVPHFLCVGLRLICLKNA